MHQSQEVLALQRHVYTQLKADSGIVAAAAGLLTVMFGSPSSLATSLARPLLERMAREGGVVACGGNGTGVGVKVCNKYVKPTRARLISPA